MNPVSDDSLDWLAQLGLVIIEERRDGSARVHASGPEDARPAPAVACDVAAAIARATGLAADDARLEALVAEARTKGAARLESAGARIALVRRGDGLLRAVVAPPDRTSAGVVHELANALTGIAGWARLAAGGGPMPERTRAALEVVERASSDALDTARTLLASLRGPLDPGAGCDVAEIVGAAITTMRPLADASDVVLRAELPPGLPVAVLPAELRAIATNVVKNAIEALSSERRSGGRRGGEIVVSARAVHAGRAIELTFVDDGPGIPASALAQIFDPWVSGKAGGTGLGLALVRDVVRARGGEVRAESGRGRGARFRIELPAVAADATAPAREEPPARTGRGGGRGSGVRRRSTTLSQAAASARSAAKEGTPAPARAARGGAARVLVVDDDEALRAMITTVLELRGAEVTALRTLAQAATLTQTAGIARRGAAPDGRTVRYDLALVDLTLPDGRGDVLVAWLAERGIARRVVVMSGTDDADRVAGASEVLRKPFTLEDLMEVLERTGTGGAGAGAKAR